MTTRAASLFFLFVAAMMTTGVAMALLLFAAAQSGAAPGAWLFTLVTFVSFVGIFFLGRATVLPASLASPPLRALAVIAGWMAVTLTAAMLVTWALRPVLALAGRRSGAAAIFLACIAGSMLLLDRYAARAGRSLR